jgi:hypothetical protein
MPAVMSAPANAASLKFVIPNADTAGEYSFPIRFKKGSIDYILIFT